jgi:hypothetical protein
MVHAVVELIVTIDAALSAIIKAVERVPLLFVPECPPADIRVERSRFELINVVVDVEVEIRDVAVTDALFPVCGAGSRAVAVDRVLRVVIVEPHGVKPRYLAFGLVAPAKLRGAGGRGVGDGD